MLTKYQWSLVAYTGWKFHRKCSRYLSLICLKITHLRLCNNCVCLGLMSQPIYRDANASSLTNCSIVFLRKLCCHWLMMLFNPRPLGPKGYCRHLRLSVRPSVCLSVCPSVCPSVCLSVPIILVNTITQSVYPISPPNLLGGFNMALSWMVL